MSNEELNLEMHAKLSYIREMRQELIDPLVPVSIKEIILKTAFND
jgi:hypothetical protein